MTWSKMSWAMEVHWWGSSELNTYSCKTGSLCDSGRPSSRGQYSLHPRTHARATMEGNWPTGDERKTVRWAKIREQKTTGGYGRSVLAGRDTTEMAPALISWGLSQKKREWATAAAFNPHITARRIDMARWSSRHASWNLNKSKY